MLVNNKFDKDIHYRLYREVKELFHPSISKQNVSSYNIVIKEGLFNSRVYYPSKVSNLNKVMIFIPGDGKLSNSYGDYSTILKNMAISTGRMVIGISYDKYKFNDNLSGIKETIIYLINELEKLGYNDIVFAGDEVGGTYLINISKLLDIDKYKKILFYPIIRNKYSLSDKYKSVKENNPNNILLINKINKYIKEVDGEEYFNLLNAKINNTLSVVGYNDILRDEVIDFSSNIGGKIYIQSSARCGFLGPNSNFVNKDVYKEINDFIGEV